MRRHLPNPKLAKTHRTYTIADISMLGWVRNLIGFYGARDLVGFDELKNVPVWLERGLARPAVQRGLEIPKPA